MLVYSAIFPATNLIGGSVMTIGIILSIPFLPLAWIGGMICVQLFGTEDAYLLGAFLTIFIQVFGLATWAAPRRPEVKT